MTKYHTERKLVGIGPYFGPFEAEVLVDNDASRVCPAFDLTTAREVMRAANEIGNVYLEESEFMGVPVFTEFHGEIAYCKYGPVEGRYWLGAYSWNWEVKASAADIEQMQIELAKFGVGFTKTEDAYLALSDEAWAELKG